MPRTTWIQGQTAPKRFRIVDKAGTPLNLNGRTVTLVLTKYRKPGSVISLAGGVTVVDADDGIVKYTPDSDDLVAADSPLFARFKIDGADGIAYAPEEDADALEWLVRPVSL